MKAYRLPVVSLLALLAFALSSPADPPDFTQGLLDRAKVIEAARALTPQAYSNGDDVVVDEVVRAEYHADGTDVTWDDEYIKTFTEKGKRERAEISIGYSAAYGTVEVPRVEVIKPDGRIVTVDVPHQSRVMVDQSQMNANIYDPNQKVLQIEVPDLEIGDVRHVISRQETRKPRVPNTWSDYMVFEYTTPFKHMVYDVFGPTDLPLTNAVLRAEIPGTVTATTERTDAGIHYRWEIKDVPRMFTEPNMPPLYTVVQRLLVSTIPDWQTLSRWYWNLSKPHLEAVTPEMKAKAVDLAGGATNRLEKIERVFKFVSQQVRYMGITTETEAPGYEPHDVKTTFENRYGVCRDKAALLAAMLRLADVPAYPVLINVGAKKDAQVPNPYFNHAIVAAEGGDGNLILMDPTDENTKELFPAYLCNMSYLVANPEGAPLRTSPIIPATNNLMRIESRGTLDASGSLTVESVLRFEGINDNAYRGYFSQVKPIERRRFFEGRIKDRIPGARITEFELQPEDMQNTAVPLRARIRYEAPDFPIRGDEYTMLPLPWLGTGIGYANFVLGQTGLAKRKYPLFTHIACGIEESFDISVDAALGRSISTPDYRPVESNTLSFAHTLTVQTNRLCGAGQFLLQTVEFSPAEYLGLKQALKDIEYDFRMKPVFKSASELSAENDVLVLSDETTVDLQDANDWTTTQSVRKQILTYAGKKKNSEIKLDYNPAWSEITLDRAAVIAPDGQVREAAKQEINTMDAGWVGSAPRYPAEKIMVVSLPGVEVGSLVEYRVTTRMHGIPFFSLNGSFRGFEPARKQSLRLIAPADLKIDIGDQTAGKVAFEQHAENGKRIYTWTSDGEKPVTREDALPPWWAFNPTVFVSDGQWTAYGAALHGALCKAAQDQAATRRKARELTAGKHGRYEKTLAIRDYVARFVRPAGPALTALPLSAITPADRTLADGYGNTSDSAVVLYTMLAEAGLKPEFLLCASSGPENETLWKPLTDCPQRGLYDEVLLRVPSDQGPLILNDSDQYGQLGTSPNEDRPALTLDGKPTTVTVAPDMADRTESDYRIDLLENGDALITVTRRFYGAEFGAFRRRFSELPPEERRRYFLEMVARVSQAAEPQGDLVTDYAQYPGRQSFTVRASRYGVRSGKYLYMTLPGLPDDLLHLRADRRENPLYHDEQLSAVTRYTVVLPESTQAIHLLPETYAWEGCGGLGTIAQTAIVQPDASHGKVVEVVQNVDLKESVVPAEDYPALLNMDRKLKHPAVRTILISLP